MEPWQLNIFALQISDMICNSKKTIISEGEKSSDTTEEEEEEVTVFPKASGCDAQGRKSPHQLHFLTPQTDCACVLVLFFMII